MNPKHLVTFILKGDDLSARQWVKDSKRLWFSFSEISMPTNFNEVELCLLAGLIELFCQRENKYPPSWVKNIGALETPIFLDGGPNITEKFKKMLINMSPEPLKRRNIFAPNKYLDVL